MTLDYLMKQMVLVLIFTKEKNVFQVNMSTAKGIFRFIVSNCKLSIILNGTETSTL